MQSLCRVYPGTRAVCSAPKLAPKPKEVWSVRLRLKREKQLRDLALFDLAVDGKLRGGHLLLRFVNGSAIRAIVGNGSRMDAVYNKD